MVNIGRRTLLATAGGVLTASAGCLTAIQTNGGEVTLDTTIGEIADTSPPEHESPMPIALAGSQDADVTVAAFEDYACPHCKTYATEVFPKLAADYLQSGDIKYEYYDYPIPVKEPVSNEVPHAARQVQKEGGAQAFFEFQERAYNNQDILQLSKYSELAEGLPVDAENVTEAAQNRQFDKTLERDSRFAEENGVEGTPFIFVNGAPLEWTEISYEPLKKAVEGEL